LKQAKICILGPTGVGKTSLIKQYVEGIFSDRYLTSVGVKIDKKNLINSLSEHVELLLWDLEGIDRYCGFNPRYLRGASAYIIVVDQTRSQSIVEGMEIHKMAQQQTDVPAILVINKCDLEATWHWQKEEIDDYAASFQQVFLTSAKTGSKVSNLFAYVAELVSV
jgi:small GTP-binding protein